MTMRKGEEECGGTEQWFSCQCLGKFLVVTTRAGAGGLAAGI